MALGPAREVLAVQHELGIGVTLAVQQRLADARLDGSDMNAAPVNGEA